MRAATSSPLGLCLVLKGAALLGVCLGWVWTAGAAEGGASYYVDGVAGQNSNAGSSPAAPWRDFSNINGKTLQPGDRLLLKRGSVINQELRVGAAGTSDRWVEIGPYGEGARPILRPNWDIRDRCALIRDPDCLRVRCLRASRRTSLRRSARSASW